MTDCELECISSVYVLLLLLYQTSKTRPSSSPLNYGLLVLPVLVLAPGQQIRCQDHKYADLRRRRSFSIQRCIYFSPGSGIDGGGGGGGGHHRSGSTALPHRASSFYSCFGDFFTKQSSASIGQRFDPSQTDQRLFQELRMFQK